MYEKPAAASCLIVPGKSLAMPSLTGQVWQPIGRPSGLAWSSKVAADKRLAAAALVAAFFMNALLDRSDIDGSLFFHFVINALAQASGVGPPLQCLRRRAEPAHKALVTFLRRRV